MFRSLLCLLHGILILWLGLILLAGCLLISLSVWLSVCPPDMFPVWPFDTLELLPYLCLSVTDSPVLMWCSLGQYPSPSVGAVCLWSVAIIICSVHLYNIHVSVLHWDYNFRGDALHALCDGVSLCCCYLSRWWTISSLTPTKCLRKIQSSTRSIRRQSSVLWEIALQSPTQQHVSRM